MAWLAVRSEADSVGEVAVLDLESERARFTSGDGQMDLVLDRGALGINQAGSAPCPDSSNEPGACCLPAGCASVTRERCAGSFYGPGTSCSEAPCPPTTLGACCLPTGGCENLEQAACEGRGGYYHRLDAGCDGLRCLDLYGTCCLPNGDCLYITRLECEDRSGLWPNLYACEPTPCSSSGACCLENWECRILTLAECVAQGGFYLDGQGGCVPNYCKWPAVNAETWGRIKGRYR
ncbi:MAG: hypothetical protein U0527_00585 [Candidatus Eisenbacteria bacterium]